MWLVNGRLGGMIKTSERIPSHLSPSTVWLLAVMDAAKTLPCHHPDLHLYLRSCHDGCRGCDVQPPLPKVDKGIVAPVFGLDKAVIDLLSQQTTNKQTVKQRKDKFRVFQVLNSWQGHGIFYGGRYHPFPSPWLETSSQPMSAKTKGLQGSSNSNCRL